MYAMTRFCFPLLALIVMLPAVGAGSDGVVVRTAPVFAAASSTSERIGELSAGTRVNIFSRQGGWKEIFSEQKSIVGWVRSYQVREGDFSEVAKVETEPDSRGFLSGLASFSRKASGLFKLGGSRTSSGTATLGVRGLSEEQIKAAEPDYGQLEKMRAYTSNQNRIDRFQRDGQLRTHKVKFLESKREKKQEKRVRREK